MCGMNKCSTELQIVVVSRLVGHRWLKLKLEPRDRFEENQVDQIQED